MDITITLYSTSDEPNKVEKTLSTNSFVITGKLKEEQDITAPAITIAIPILSTGVPATDIFQWNYAYISQPFKRYYFITGFDTGLNNLVTIYFEEDYLMSWKTNIYNLSPLVTRQATEYNPMLFDGDIPINMIPDIVMSRGGLKNFNGTVLKSSFSYSMTIFSNASDNSDNLNGMTGINRVYLFNSITDVIECMISISKPDFWTSVDNWFTNFAENIISLNFIPFDVKSTITGTALSGQHNINFMANVFEKETMTVYKIHNDNYCMFRDYLQINVKETNSFLDSLVQYELILPFIGKIKLDTNFLIYYNVRNLYITYIVNPNNWTCEVFVTRNRIDYATGIQKINYDEIIYKSEKFTISSEIPLGSTNANQRNLSLLGYGVKAVASVAAAPFTGGASLMGLLGVDLAPSKTVMSLKKRTEDKRLKVGSEKYNERMAAYKTAKTKETLGKTISGASNVLLDILPMTISEGNIISENQGMFNMYSNTMSPVLIVTKPVPNIPSNYYELYGGPCNLTVPLSQLKDKGFTVCANLHMTGFSNCTLEEINEIEDLLLSGVIL